MLLLMSWAAFFAAWVMLLAELFTARRVLGFDIAPAAIAETIAPAAIPAATPVTTGLMRIRSSSSFRALACALRVPVLLCPAGRKSFARRPYKFCMQLKKFLYCNPKKFGRAMCDILSVSSVEDRAALRYNIFKQRSCSSFKHDP